MSQDGQTPETVQEKMSQYKEIIKQFEHERENYIKLWKIFTSNVLSEDFKYSRWAGLSLIFIPTIVNVYFLYRPDALFRNTIRFASILGCVLNLQHQLNQDFLALMKKDTPLANQARVYLQNIAAYDLKKPDLGKETLEIIRNYFFVFYYSKNFC